MALKTSGVLRALLVVGVLLSGVLTYLHYTRTQYPTHRPITLITDFSSYLLSFITRPLLRRFFTIPESDWNRDREVHGLQNPVDVYRDDMGIPYIFAHTEHDAEFARVFVEYTERPFQYEFLRRLATGRLAENFGEDYVPVDFYTRIHMDRDYLRYQVANLSPEKKALVDTAIMAINQAAAQLPATPIEFVLLGWTHTDWTPLDFLTVRQAMALQLSRGYTIDYTRAALQHYLKDYWTRFDLKTAKGVPPMNTEGEHPSLFNQRGERMQLPPLPALDDKWAKLRPQDVEKLLERLRSAPAKGQQVPQQDEGAAGAGASSDSTTFGTASWSGSNAWAVSGRFTASGKPILASDTHLQATAPGFWMPIFSSVGPSKLLTSSFSGDQRRQQRSRVTGASPVGAACVAVGHNGEAAWGQTVSHTDTADLYLVHLNREGTHYLYDGRWYPLRTRVEEISVKGKSAKVKKIARYTHHGPLYSDAVPIFDKLLKPGEAVAIAAVAGRAPIPLDYQNALTHAVTWQQFLEAAAIDEQLGLVTVWATAQGDVGATPSGAIPVRTPPREKHRFRDGSSSAADWNGVLPPTRIPTVVNPPSGFVGVGNSKLSEDPSDIYGSVFTPGIRQRRVQELLRELTARGNLRSADMVEMQNDVHSIQGREFRDYVLRTVLFAYKPRTDAPAQLEDTSRHSVTVRTICAEEGLTEEDGRWLYTTMGQWDANMDVDSVGATVADIWQQWTLQILLKKHGLSDEVLRVLLGAPLNDVWLPAFEILNHWTYNLLRALDERADVVTDVSSSERLVCSGAVAALKWLRARYGDSSDAWKWGDVRARFIDHPLGAAVPLLRHTASVGPLRWGGNFATIKSHHIIAGELSLENLWNAAYTKSLDTPVLRMCISYSIQLGFTLSCVKVVDLGNLENSFWSVLPGVSGWVANKHYDNFASSIEATKGTAHMRPMLWTDDQIEQAAVTHMKLLPKKPSPAVGDKEARRDYINNEL